jgi:hypothetical protein
MNGLLASNKQDDINNPWATVPIPLSDIYLQEIAPGYLTVRDFIRLSAVSRRYKELFDPQSLSGNKILGSILLRDAEHRHYCSPNNTENADDSYEQQP